MLVYVWDGTTSGQCFDFAHFDLLLTALCLSPCTDKIENSDPVGLQVATPYRCGNGRPSNPAGNITLFTQRPPGQQCRKPQAAPAEPHKRLDRILKRAIALICHAVKDNQAPRNPVQAVQIDMKLLQCRKGGSGRARAATISDDPHHALNTATLQQRPHSCGGYAGCLTVALEDLEVHARIIRQLNRPVFLVLRSRSDHLSDSEADPYQPAGIEGLDQLLCGESGHRVSPFADQHIPPVALFRPARR
ncbi:hypothetical protein B0J12DRAFT_670558 [Macrophomina phaseolina]|uniref:Uncharacterized protein n=1 Tax=Macrophomina phaseolina TaxID=35725 RepID=A0ABQ8G5A7_9PEZI|nr:hypothetical protein B0J12DRAFT_670558 [Macrophomina phaseolina]